VSKPVPAWRVALFVAPQLALAVLGLPIVLYLQPYYASQPGYSLSLVAFIFMITRVWDVITDPTLGWVGDSVRTRFGRRRFWIAINTPVMLLGVVMVFLPQSVPSPLMLGLWLAVLYVGWTFIHMSHVSWASELSHDYDQRTTIQSFVTGAYILGILAALFIGVAAAQGITDQKAALEAQVRAVGGAVLVLLPLSVLLALVVTPETPPPPVKPLALGEMFATLARNGPLARVAGADFLSGFASGATGASLIFIGTQVLGLSPAQSPALILISFVAGFLTIPLWAWLAKKLGKHNAIIASSLYTIATAPLIFLVPKGDFAVAALVWALGGANFAAAIFLARAVLGDVVDADKVRTGDERSGMYFGVMSAANKMGYAAAGLVYVLLEAVGYDPNASAQTPSALAWLIGAYVGVPIACALGVMALMWRFPIDRQAQAAAVRTD
jgi:glycoside/pentoside/hexuronide:cation symporter, GPH family